MDKLKTPPDFTASARLNWIHRRIGDTQVYFVAAESPAAVEAQCAFRVQGLRPEIWNPENGQISWPAVYEETAAGISMPLRFEPSGSCFVVFRPPQKRFDPVVSFTQDGQPAIPLPRSDVIKIQKAIYGVPGDTVRTRDARAKLQAMVNRGEINFQVAELAKDDDPAYGVVKTLQLEYTADGQPFTFSGHDTDTVSLIVATPTASRAAELRCDSAGRLEIVASQPGHYELKTAGGKIQRVEIATVPAPLELTGAWDVYFPLKWGAPGNITLDHLISLSDSTNAGVKYFSGTATYAKTFDWKPPAQTGSATTENWLDLGEVQVMAQVKLNGHDLGILWKPPFRVNVSGARHSGPNKLEIRVADLWPNRMIGDAALPPSERFTWSSYEPFTKDSPLPKSGLLGPVTLRPAEKVILEGN